MPPRRFLPLRVADLRRETDECLSVALDVPPEHVDDFRYQPGQYLTFRTVLDGVELRRSYSICTAPSDSELRVAVKQVPGGAFSSYIASSVKPGDLIDVLPPEGRFTPAPDPKARRHVVGVAAGSGITPVIGIVRHVLATEPTARVTIVYGNRTASSIVFREQLAGLKDRYLERLRVLHVLSREGSEIPLHDGRIDAQKVRQLLSTVLDPEDIDEV